MLTGPSREPPKSGKSKAAPPITAAPDAEPIDREPVNPLWARLALRPPASATGASPPPIRVKLTVGPPADESEREADAVADRVMRMPAPGPAPTDKEEEPAPGPIRWACAECEEELAGTVAAALSRPGGRSGGPLRRAIDAPGEEQSPLLRKAADSGSLLPTASDGFSARLRATRGTGRPLPSEVRGFVEPRMGACFDAVRIHTDRKADGLSRRIQARAFTHGPDIYFADGQYRPEADDGRRLIAHELAHVVQGRPGRQAAEPGPGVGRVKELLGDGDEEGSISLMGQLSTAEVDAVLSNSAIRAEAVDTFDNEEMYRAIRAMRGDLFYSLRWLFEEGTDWDYLEVVLREVTRDQASVRRSSYLKDQFVSELDDEEMAEAVDLLGGTLQEKLRWMAAEGSNWSLISAKVRAAGPEERLALYEQNDIRDLFTDVCDDEEMADAVELLGGPLLYKVIWMGDEGTDCDTLREKIRAAPLEQRLALYGSGAARAVFVDVCNDQEMRGVVDDLGGTVRMKLTYLLAEGEFDYVPDPGETLPVPSEPPVAVDAPVIFAVDMQDDKRRVYASVTAPGHSNVEVARYLYGSDDPSVLGSVPPLLSPGQPIRLTGDRLAPGAQADLDRAIESGTALRSSGMIEETQSHAILYRFSAGGRLYQLTPLQMRGMLAGMAFKYRIKAESIAGLSENLNEDRDKHKEDTNRVVRGISDYLGDVELPSKGFADKAISLANSARDTFESLDPSDIPSAQEALGRGMKALIDANEAYARAELYWKYYIQGTIEGAGAAVTTLEITRDVSFAVAAGLAGAVAAPAAFGAVATSLTGGGATALTTGGALVAGGSSIVAGAGAGSLVKGGLEFTAASGQQFVGPGEFDWGYVGERTGKGLRSGAFEGAMGAASHFQGAYLAQRFGQAFAATRTGQLTIGAISGGSTEFAMATGEQLISPGPGGFSWSQVGLRTALGTGLGAGATFLPIHGLYRVRPGGGVSAIPLRGIPAVPEWMLASPWHFVQPRGAATPGSALTPRGAPNYRAINDLPAGQLPVLPEGYTWARVRGTEWGVVRPPNRPNIEVYVWGPDANGRFDFTVRQADPAAGPSRMLYSEAHTRSPTRPQSQRQGNALDRNLPAGDYTDPNTGVQYRRGHGIDHADTSGTIGPTDATVDPANFSPQTRNWNDLERNNLVGRVRAGEDPVTGQAGGSTAGPNPIYREVSYYDGSAPPATTIRGEPVPDGVYMIIADANGMAQYAFHVPRTFAFATGQGRVNVNIAALQVQLDQVPTAVIHASGFSFVSAGATRGASGARSREGEKGGPR